MTLIVVWGWPASVPVGYDVRLAPAAIGDPANAQRCEPLTTAAPPREAYYQKVRGSCFVRMAR
jgi:hypothetical protein